MLLYILRHADAGLRSASSDWQRKLTPRGREQALRVGAFCSKQQLCPELVLTSPVDRARETAELFLSSFKEKKDFLENPTGAANCGVASVLAPSSTLTRIFHTDLLRKPGSPMNIALDSDFDLSSVYSHSSASKSSSALSHQPSQLPRDDQYEISGLSTLLPCAPSTPCTSSAPAGSPRSLIELVEQSWMACGMTPAAALKELSAYSQWKSLLLVGHEPDLSCLIATLLGMPETTSLDIKKASLTAISLEKVGAGKGTLQFFIPCEILPS